MMTPEQFPELTTEAFAALGGPNLVYVRPVMGAEILASLPAASIEGFELKPDQTLSAVHRADGARLAHRQASDLGGMSHSCKETEI